MKRLLMMTLGALLVAAILVAAGLASPPAPVTAPEKVRAQDPAAVPALAGGFNGEVKLDWALSGVYSDTLATPTPGPADASKAILGDMDLGILLKTSGDQVSGYVDLASSLVFTQEHTILATPSPLGTPQPGDPTPEATELGVGPSLTGSFDGTNLTLVSERIKTNTTTGQSLLRQFSLTGHKVEGIGNQFAGEYRETFWGYGLQPLTLVGRFKLVQPVLDLPDAPPTPTATPTPLASPTPTTSPTPSIGNEKSYLPLMQRQ